MPRALRHPSWFVITLLAAGLVLSGGCERERAQRAATGPAPVAQERAPRGIAPRSPAPTASPRLVADTGAGARWVEHHRPAGALRQVVRGTVAGVDIAAGALRLRVADDLIPVRGVPWALRPLRPGDAIVARVRVFDGIYWIDPRRRATPPARGSGRVQGAVAWVEPARGVMGLARDGRVAVTHAHPASISGLVPGQPVRVQLRRIGSRDWAVTVEVRPDWSAAGLAPRAPSSL